MIACVEDEGFWQHIVERQRPRLGMSAPDNASLTKFAAAEITAHKAPPSNPSAIESNGIRKRPRRSGYRTRPLRVVRIQDQ